MTDIKSQIIVANKKYLIAAKPNGQPSQKSARGDDSFQNQLEAYQKKSLHILTRLDRPVSGLVLFSKNADFTKHYLKEQENNKVEKTYLAIVEGQWDDKLTSLTHYHHHDKKNKKARLSRKSVDGANEVKLSCTVRAKLDRYTILELSLRRGRFHQIRAQLADMGHPIKGDVKYGARRGNKDRSIHLHALGLRFKDLLGVEQSHRAAVPQEDSLWKLAVDDPAPTEPKPE